MSQVIKTIVDDERIFMLKPNFDRSVITCLARLDGHVVGIIANQPLHTAGAMGPDGGASAAASYAFAIRSIFR